MKFIKMYFWFQFVFDLLLCVLWVFSFFLISNIILEPYAWSIFLWHRHKSISSIWINKEFHTTVVSFWMLKFILCIVEQYCHINWVLAVILCSSFKSVEGTRSSPAACVFRRATQMAYQKNTVFCCQWEWIFVVSDG